MADLIELKIGGTSVLNSSRTINISLLPSASNTYNMGSSSYGWKDLNLHGYLYLHSDNTCYFHADGAHVVASSSTIYPNMNDTYNLGTIAGGTFIWKNLYIGTGKIYLGASQEANLYLSGTTLKTDDTFDCAAILVNGAPVSFTGSTLYIYFYMRGL